VKAPGPAGRPVGQARVTTWHGSGAASREHSAVPSPPEPSPDADEPATTPAVPWPGVSSCLAQVTSAACMWPPQAARHQLRLAMPRRTAPTGDCSVATCREGIDARAHADRGMNRTENAVYRCLLECEMSMDAGDKILRLLRDEGMDFREVRFGQLRTYHTRMQAADLGIEHADLAHAGDGQEVLFWYRRAWRTLRPLLQRAKNTEAIVWGFGVRQVSAERVFSSFNDSVWLEGAYQLPGMAGKTVVGVMIGSDGAQFKKKLYGHPIYVSCANFTPPHRQSPKGWSLLGFVPELDQQCCKYSDFEFKRRKRQIMDACLCLVTQDMLHVVRAGGETVACGDGRTRCIVPLLAIYATDRQEHETVLHAKAHSCFHCDVPATEKSNAQWRGKPQCAARVKSQTSVGMSRGVYGRNSEWTKLIQHEKPIMRVKRGGLGLDVVSEQRYSDFARVMGHYPEPNNFVNGWLAVGVDAMHACRDDPMHMVQLGLMQHLLTACISRIIRTLSPEWACRAGQQVGRLAMMRICNRMGARLQQSAPHLSGFAAGAMARAFANATTDAECAGRMSWGLTAFEMEAVFRASVMCWKGLINHELLALHSDAARIGGRTHTAADPTEDMAATLGFFLSWYNGMRQSATRQSAVSVLWPCAPMLRALATRRVRTLALHLPDSRHAATLKSVLTIAGGMLNGLFGILSRKTSC
jgi:hypothetical protein